MEHEVNEPSNFDRTPKLEPDNTKSSSTRHDECSNESVAELK